MRYPLISVLLCALITALPVHAAMYKYVDENGQTIYSQSPPPAGTEGVERIKAPPRPASSKSNAAAQKTKEDAAAQNERADEQKTGEQDQKKMQQAESERKKQCEQMRQDVDTLTTRPVVRRASADGGEPVVLTGEERESEVKALRENLKKNCK